VAGRIANVGACPGSCLSLHRCAGRALDFEAVSRSAGDDLVSRGMVRG